MFTGIAEEKGKILEVGSSFKIAADIILSDIHIGDSIAVNGVCLTVTAFTGSSFTVDVMPETLRCTNLGTLKYGSEVNLERAMPTNGRFGGHIVSGHIDGTGTITAYKRDSNAIWLSIKADREIMRYIVQKGSVTLDGISLTVARCGEDGFAVSLIPHTSEVTTLTGHKSGYKVNIETDVIARYVERLMQFKGNSGLDKDFLARCGF